MEGIDFVKYLNDMSTFFYFNRYNDVKKMILNCWLNDSLDNDFANGIAVLFEFFFFLNVQY